MQPAQQPGARLQPVEQLEACLQTPSQHPTIPTDVAPLQSQQQDVPDNPPHLEALQLYPSQGSETESPPLAPYPRVLDANNPSSDPHPFSPEELPPALTPTFSEELPPAPPPSFPDEELPPTPPSSCPEELLLHFDCPDWSRDAWHQCMVMVDSRAFPGALSEALPLQPEALTRLRARTGSADDLEVGCGL